MFSSTARHKEARTRGLFCVTMYSCFICVISPKHHQYFTKYNAFNQSTMDQLQREEQIEKSKKQNKRWWFIPHRDISSCMYNTICLYVRLLMVPSTAAPWQLCFLKKTNFCSKHWDLLSFTAWWCACVKAKVLILGLWWDQLLLQLLFLFYKKYTDLHNRSLSTGNPLKRLLIEPN